MTKKTKVITWVTVSIFIVILGVVGFFLVRRYMGTVEDARASLTRLERLEELNTEIQSEINACEELITMETGDFSQFEYCKKFLIWSSGFKE